MSYSNSVRRKGEAKTAMPALGVAVLAAFATIFSGQTVIAQQFPDLAAEETLDTSIQAGTPYLLSEPSSVTLRGTTGSGEQEPVFSSESPLSTAQTPEETTTIPASRDTSDPVLQLQGRVQPTLAQTAVTDPMSVGTPTSRSNIAAPRAQDIVQRVPEDDPFSASGFRIGSWRAFLTLEQTLGYSTNAGRIAMGDPGAFSQSDGTLSLQSDWSRHSAQIDLSGSYVSVLNSDITDIPSFNAAAALNMDLIDGVTARLGATYGYTTESASSSTITLPAVNRPGVHSTGVSAEISRTGHRLITSLRGSVGRTDYNAIELSNGTMVSQGDRNNTLYTATGRVGYEISPAIIPFAELEVGRRIHDFEVDNNGDKRDSMIYAMRTGVAVDLGEKLKGEIAAGYRVEDFEGSNLETLGGFTVDGNIQWSPQRDTMVALTSQTSFSGSTTGGQNGAIVHDLNLAISKQVNDRLSLNANAGVMINRQDDGSRTDVEWTIGTGFNYWVNRFMAFTGSVDHVTQQSTTAASAYDATTVKAGIKLQR